MNTSISLFEEKNTLGRMVDENHNNNHKNNFMNREYKLLIIELLFE